MRVTLLMLVKQKKHIKKIRNISVNNMNTCCIYRIAENNGCACHEVFYFTPYNVLGIRYEVKSRITNG